MDETDPEQDFVMGILEPHFASIASIYDEAVALYNSGTTPQARADHDNRAALGSIYCHAWKGYQREFMDRPGFHFMELRGLRLLNISDKVVIRAKRVDANGHHVNSDTLQQQRFDRQFPLTGLPPAAVRVVVGYELDPAFSTVERVIVRRSLGRWVSQIVNVEGSFRWNDITPVELPFRAGRRAAR